MSTQSRIEARDAKAAGGVVAEGEARGELESHAACIEAKLYVGDDGKTYGASIEEQALAASIRTILDALTAAQAREAGREGWVLVPIEPTREMWAAAGDAVVALQHDGIGHHDRLIAAVWRAMIAAALRMTPPAMTPAGLPMRGRG